MSVFRNHTPKRRNIATAVTKYGHHRANLKIDYLSRCGYCNDVDTWRFIWFEIDHFVPQKHLVAISKTDYSNLVYACRSCNNAKKAHWPTEDEKVHNQNNEGFIDPCHDEYNNQFTRLADGRVIPQTLLGQWMYNALKLYKPQHEIIWNIEQLDLMIDEIQGLLKDFPSTSLTERLLICCLEFRKYIKALSNAGF